MKTTLKNYSFNTSTRVITLTDVGTVRLDRLFLITDVTTNKIIYNFADNTVATATVSTNTITLSTLQGGEANSDKLQIIYDVISTDTAFADSLEAVAIDELPNPAAVADGTSNPTLSQIATFPSIYNGATWERLRGDLGDGSGATGLLVNNPLLYNGTTYDRQRSIGTGIAKSSVSDATNDANVLAGDTGFNGLIGAGAQKTIAFSTSAAGAQTLLANTDLRGYSSIEIVYTSVGVGLALSGQFSPTSGGAYVSATTFGNPAGSGANALGVANSTIYRSPIMGNFFQIAVSALTSGTFAGTITLRTVPAVFATVSVTGTTTLGVTAPTNASSSAYENSRVIKASTGSLWGISGYNSGPAQFIQLHNTTTLPADTTVPVWIYYVPANSPFAFDWGTRGRNFATGITICNSTTGPTKTIGAANCWFDVQYT